MSSRIRLSNPEEVSITVIEAHNLPDIKSKNLFKNGQYRITVEYKQGKSKKTKRMQSEDDDEIRNLKFENIIIGPSSSGIILRCFVKKGLRSKPIGTLELPIVTFHTFSDKGLKSIDVYF